MDADTAVIVMEAPAPPMAPATPPPIERPRSGPSIGLSMGLSTGLGPTLGIPLGHAVTVDLTLLPVLVPDAGGGGSFGVRVQEFIGRNPRSRLYLVEGASMSGWSESWLWGGGVGAGVEVCKDPSVGLRKWFDLSLTAFGTDELVAVLPLPELGVTWVF